MAGYVRPLAQSLRPSSLFSALQLPRTSLLHPTSNFPLIRLLSTDARAKIDGAIKAHPLVVFMKGTPAYPQCGFSRAVVQLLEMHGVKPGKVQTYNCLEDQELREGIKEYSDWPTIPQVYIDGEFQGGCDTMMEMHKSGELERLLVDKSLTDAPFSQEIERGKQAQ